MHPQGVTAQGKEKALAEAEQAGVTPKQIHSESEHCVAKIFAIQVNAKIADVKEAVWRNESVEDREKNKRDEGNDSNGNPFSLGKKWLHVFEDSSAGPTRQRVLRV